MKTSGGLEGGLRERLLGTKFSIGQKLAKQYSIGWGPRRRNPGSTTRLY